MHYRFINEILTYDGTQLSSLWALRNFDVQGDSILSFRGPCTVEISAMVDLEDVKNQAVIYSTDMLHYIIEHFDLDLEKTILRQRLFISIIKEVIENNTRVNLRRQGDDLYFNEKKLSVSIATLSPVSTMIHTGINISSKDTPVPAVGLAELGVKNNDIARLGSFICSQYAQEIKGIRLARCKVRGVK